MPSLCVEHCALVVQFMYYWLATMISLCKPLDRFVLVQSLDLLTSNIILTCVSVYDGGTMRAMEMERWASPNSFADLLILQSICKLSRAEMVGCLSKVVLDDVMNEKSPRVSPRCRNQLRVELFQRVCVSSYRTEENILGFSRIKNLYLAGYLASSRLTQNA